MKVHKELVYKELLELKNSLSSEFDEITKSISIISSIMIKAIRDDKAIFICGNGGSASQSEHFAGELLGRFKNSRPPFKAISLTSDSSLITCIANDYGYEHIFSRQIEALGSESDVLICLSTSGTSLNILKALNQAKRMNLISLGFFGEKVKDAEKLTDHSLIVRSETTARIQELHLFSIHCICKIIDNELGYG